MSSTQLFVVLSAVVLAIAVLELVRRRRLREQYLWTWLGVAACFLALAFLPALATAVSGLVEARSIFSFAVLGILLLFVISVQFSVHITRLVEQNKDLAQQIAILNTEVRRLRIGLPDLSPEGGEKPQADEGEAVN